MSFYEALILFGLYIGYVTIMKFNIQLKARVTACVPWGDKVEPGDTEAAETAAASIFSRNGDGISHAQSSGIMSSNSSVRQGQARKRGR